MEFFGITTRHFVVSFWNQLSRVALRTYAYLRTWCISPAGQSSDWRELRVSKIAADLEWSPRYVRKGLAELERAKLIQRRAQWVMLDDGVRAQGPNVYRVLAEPGFPVAAEPVEEKKAPRTAQVAEVVEAVTREIEVVVASVNNWAADAAADTEHKRIELVELVDWCAARTDEPNSATPEQIDEMRELAVEHGREVAIWLAVAQLPPAEAAGHPRMRQLVVDTLANRAARALHYSGRRRDRITREIVTAVLREELTLRGITWVEREVPNPLPNA